MNTSKTYYSNGKLLLTGEYVVLDGATALAIPTKYGQSLTVSETNSNTLQWTSKDVSNNIWFETEIHLDTLKPILTCNISETLCSILQTARKHNPSFLKNNKGYLITTKLDFPRDWGLGTSSTLINNIAQWAQIDAFKLLNESFGGSGYDIAAAQHDSPIFYTSTDTDPIVQPCTLSWDFSEQLYFVYLNKKQDSKKGIATYKTKHKDPALIATITEYSKKLLLCYTLQDFERLLEAHEQKIARLLAQPTIKESLFSTYKNTIKSLGAWGGDFILVTGSDSDMEYFRNKGYTTIISFKEMIISS